MLKDDLKTGMLAAMKAGHTVEKNILRLALGEIQTEEARSTRDAGADGSPADGAPDGLPDGEVQRILRKLIKSIGESLQATDDQAKRKGLREEIAVLEGYLPRTLGFEEIKAALAPVEEQLVGAGNDGQATGIAMKHLKSVGAVVEGKDVSAAVRAMRSG